MLETVHSSDLEAAIAAAEQGLDGADASADRVVCRVTGRLDVMGGIADVAGALSLSATLSAGVSVAAQLRGDGGVYVAIHSASNDAVVAAYDDRIQDRPAMLSADHVAGEDALARLVAATAQMALASNRLPGLSGGVTLHVWPGFDALSAGLEAAAQVATCRALIAVARADDVSPVDLFDACRVAHLHGNGFPVGPAALLAVQHPMADGLQEIHPDGLRVAGPLALPAGVRCVGVDTGLVHERHAEKQRDVYVETEMGGRIIDALRRSESPVGDAAPVRLTDIHPEEFVRSYRDKLPTRLRGRDFIAHFGVNEIEGIKIEPGKTYKVRSRVEHHLYENNRVHEFVSTLARARNTGRVDALQRAGHLMYSSHWSYGQRCGLGSIETDLLVNLLRARGETSGVYGARVSGFGAGGMVTVLVAEQAIADGVIDAAAADLRDQSVARPAIYETNGEPLGADPRWFGPNA